MNGVDNTDLTNYGSVGGGEVLDYVGGGEEYDAGLMNKDLIESFLRLPYVRMAIIVCILILAALLIIRIYKVRNPFGKRSISKEFDHMAAVRKHDEQILKANRMIRAFTNIVENSVFSMSTVGKDYWAYNLTRADVRIPGKSRIMKPEEFHAITVSVEAFVILVSALIGILFNIPVGVLLIIATIAIGNTMPMIMLRNNVKMKDQEVEEHFVDMYLMIHYVLLASGSTPIAGILKSFDKTTNSNEMHKFVDVCVHYMDTYGEYEATGYISRAYREIPQVVKLMRLMKQANQGGSVRQELIGFKTELLNERKYLIEKRMNKLIAKARFSFNILYGILIQAIISAMGIYFKDLGGIGSFMS
jgi:ABC-type multidrug transport system fused ATPase/permease subunit